jgi:hypothetical protein
VGRKQSLQGKSRERALHGYVKTTVISRIKKGPCEGALDKSFEQLPFTFDTY